MNDKVFEAIYKELGDIISTIALMATREDELERRIVALEQARLDGISDGR